MYFFFVFLPSACTSCFYSFLQHALLVFIPSFSMYKNKKYMLKEGIKTRTTS
jgi:hypothetical protein